VVKRAVDGKTPFFGPNDFSLNPKEKKTELMKSKINLLTSKRNNKPLKMMSSIL
jgi:hypothetical protein